MALSILCTSLNATQQPYRSLLHVAELIGVLKDRDLLVVVNLVVWAMVD